MTIDRSEYESNLLQFFNIKETVDVIESDFIHGPEYDDQPPNVFLELKKSDRDVHIRTHSEGSIYEIRWNVNITPSDDDIKMKRINLEQDEVVFEFPMGEYQIEAEVEYQTDKGEYKQKRKERIKFI